MINKDVKKVLVIGSGPIVIGQAAEFDYAGTQACRSLREEGVEVVLVNSNPSTIMTDVDIADRVYIEPITLPFVTEVIKKERPDALLATLGGQVGLNMAVQLSEAGVLEKYNVKLLGSSLHAIKHAEDRELFKEAMEEIHQPVPESEIFEELEPAVAFADKIGYPVIIRPAYTLGGTGGGIAHDRYEMEEIANRGIKLSPINQILVERSIAGWKEVEFEVMRDSADNCIIVCAMENIDPVGVHTGDSFCSAPMLTIPEDVQKELQEMSYRIIESIEVIGGCNCQFARNPETGRIVVIEINPRTSRSSALASKATGFPIAFVSALLACGLTLGDIPCGKYGTLDKYYPDGDYIVIKFARWAFEKFKGAEDKLGTQMRAVGEVMSIGKTYKEAFQKAIRSLEKDRYGLGFAKNFHDMTKEELLAQLRYPTSERQFVIYEALRKGATIEEIHALTKIKDWFLQQMKELVDEEEALLKIKGSVPEKAVLKQAKLDGFSDRYLSSLLEVTEEEIRNARIGFGIKEAWEGVHVSGTDNAAYYYSTYHLDEDKSPVSDKPKIMILGGGPNRIGQGIEFDYCCVHAALALKKLGFESIIVNCNPETVSTDYDTSDKLYFEPLTLEDVLSIHDKEKPLGVIAQFGGQTPLNLASDLKKYGVNILGTTPETIDLAEDRDHFRAMMDKLGIPMPESGMAVNVDEALEIANRIGYPVMVRPSYVLGGRGMEIVHDDEMMKVYMSAAVGVTPDRPILIDRFLHHATECEADAISDGKNCFVPAVMEHIELAGVHSGDSACILPSLNLTEKQVTTIKDYTKKIAVEMNVCGLMNMQYAIEDDTVYVLEANPRASRTVPLVSKVCNINMVQLATQIITSSLTGKPSPVPELHDKVINHYGVKEAVFPFNMFQEVDPVLGPEMRSTGEVLGIAPTFGEAYYKAQEATQVKLPLGGTVLLSVCDRDKPELLEIAKSFSELGFRILATGKSYDMIKDAGITAERINKMYEGRPNITDAIANGDIQLIINTPAGKTSANDDSYIRKSAIRHKVPYITTMAAAKASIEGIKSLKANKHFGVKSIQAHHADIK